MNWSWSQCHWASSMPRDGRASAQSRPFAYHPTSRLLTCVSLSENESEFYLRREKEARTQEPLGRSESTRLSGLRPVHVGCILWSVVLGILCVSEGGCF